jgi:hypothetical protein
MRMAAAGLVVLLGAGAAANTTVVVAAVMLVAAAAILNGRPTTWIILAVTIVWTSRLLTVWGHAPRFLDFLDFALVFIAFVFAGIRHLNTDRQLPPRQLKILRRLFMVFGIIAVSWAFNDYAEPQRLVAGALLVLEPFLLLSAVLITPMTVRERRTLIILLVTLLCGQSIFSIVQVAGGAINDDIKGTLLQAGAGHHVSAGGLAIGFFVLTTLKVSRFVKLGFGAVALTIMILADAKQVLFVLPLGLLLLGITAVRIRSGLSVIGGVIAGVGMAVASIYALLSYQASTVALDFVDRSATNKTGKLAVIDALWHDVMASPATALFGLGPGQSVSRFAFLTTAGLLKDGSPILLLGVTPSRGAEVYDAIAFSGPFTGGSSFTSAQSSGLGIFGDYGLVGVLGFVALVWAVLSAVFRVRDRAMRSAALASWAMLLPLAVVFDWLEQPPFTLAIMVLTGIALRDRASLGPPPTALAAAPESRSAAPGARR